ncbi:MAG: flagellar basal body P-ring formation protein FlgA, partial [Gluconacetobacter diazotrophicus]|nr:flagellar basal body P-ring formation protein FlgA [Gluconacetobacter diazotrophicus]
PDGRFAATLRFTPPDAEPVELHVGGRIEDTVPVLVLARPLSAGSVLQPGDLVPARLTRQRVSGTALTDPTDAVGLRIARAAGAGTPVSAAMLERPPAVAKNHPVVLRLQGDGLTLTASGTALEAGSLGDVIHVLNTASRAVLLGRVVNNTDIRIEPGTAPVPAAGNGMGGGAGNGGWRAGPGRMS